MSFPPQYSLPDWCKATLEHHENLIKSHSTPRIRYDQIQGEAEWQTLPKSRGAEGEYAGFFVGILECNEHSQRVLHREMLEVEEHASMTRTDEGFVQPGQVSLGPYRYVNRNAVSRLDLQLGDERTADTGTSFSNTIRFLSKLVYEGTITRDALLDY